MPMPVFHQENLNKFSFLVTGGAGFIGSHLVEYLLQHGAKRVVVMDNLSTGAMSNVELFKSAPNYHFLQADICDVEACNEACKGIDFVFHQAALGSVPRSIKDPIATNHSNINGFLNVLIAARDQKVRRLVYASSSSVFGDSPALPKSEEQLGNPLSPYAVTKRVNELYAHVFAKVYSMEIIGLRYFNIFGPRQQPNGPYAAAIPLFMQALLDHKSPFINGDGEQSRDFTYVENAVQANIKAMFCNQKEAIGEVFNIALGDRITVNELFDVLKMYAKSDIKPQYREERAGDVKHSLADISKAKRLLSYAPGVQVKEGLYRTFDWFTRNNQ
jgi:UDP-N-acetylglucosamine 4-epimerase